MQSRELEHISPATTTAFEHFAIKDQYCQSSSAGGSVHPRVMPLIVLESPVYHIVAKVRSCTVTEASAKLGQLCARPFLFNVGKPSAQWLPARI